MRASITLLLAASALGLAASAAADEGMWLPSQAPEIAKQLKSAGLKLDPNALANRRTAPMNAIARSAAARQASSARKASSSATTTASTARSNTTQSLRRTT
jgi:hypothetical protein